MAQEALGHLLVHRERTPESVGAGVGDAGDVEKGLDRAVLAATAVQCQEEDVDVAERRIACQRDRVALVQRRERRGLRWRRSDTSPPQASLLVGTENPSDRVHRDGVVPRLSQSLGDLSTGSERNVTLVGGPTHQDRDPHAVSARTTS